MGSPDSAAPPAPAAVFSVPVAVRGYELDVNGHVTHANYHRYGEHARTEHMVAAGCTIPALKEHGLGPVLLETRVRFLNELTYGDTLEVSSVFAFGEGKTFGCDHTLRRADGVVAAEIECRMGLLDLEVRRLVADPRGRLREIASEPDLLG